MAKVVKLNTIKAPSLYIRQAVDSGHVKDLQDVIIANKDKAYPFHDPIVIRKLAKPEKVKLTMANKPGTAEYELIRGLNRCMALTNEKWNEASADIVEAGDAEAFAMQFDDPEVGVILKHNLADRNFYIRTLRDHFGWQLKQIGERMRLSDASVSRILNEKQATGKSKPRKKRSKGRKTATVATNGGTMTVAVPNGAKPEFVPSEFFSILGELVAAYAKNKDAVMGFVDKVDPAIISASENMVAEILGNR